MSNQGVKRNIERFPAAKMYGKKHRKFCALKN